MLEPLVIHSHIPKAGGSALHQLLRMNYLPGQLVRVDGLDVARRMPLDVPDSWDTAVAEWRRWYGSLNDDARAGLRCLTGHQSAFLIEAVNDRPVRPFCMLRDPVESVISAYLFLVWQEEHRGRAGRSPSILKGLRDRRWGLKDVYLELGGADAGTAERDALFGGDFFAWCFNWQTRHILLGSVKPAEIPFEADGEALRAYRERALAILAEVYTVGTQDRFSQSVRLFADTFGWRRVFVPRANVGALRSREAELGIDAETRELIRHYNQADAELHRRYSERLRELPPVGRLTDARGRSRRHLQRARSGVRRRAAQLMPS